MKRLIFFALAVLIAGNALAANTLSIMEDGKILPQYLPTVELIQDGDPAEPFAGQLWWNNSTNQLKVAGALGIYAFNATSMVAWDTTPTAFTFTDVTGATRETVYTSDAVTVAGINWPAAISVSGDATAKYSINNATATATNGTVTLGDEVRAVVTSSGSSLGVVNATVSIGGVSDVYSVTTEEITTGFVGIDPDDLAWARTMPSSGSVTLWRYQANSTGEISRLSITALGGDAFQMAIYSDNAGEPGTLLGSTVNATNDWSFSWKRADLQASVTISSGSYYWIGLHSPGDWFQVKASGTSGAAAPVRRYAASSFPSTWPTADDTTPPTDDQGGAIYADHP